MSDDWRVTEGPAMGIEPSFALRDVSVHADFYVPGGMGRRIMATLTTDSPAVVESQGRPLSAMPGLLRIYGHQTERSSIGHMVGRYDMDVPMEAMRGVLAVFDEGYAVHLYLPREQFAELLPLFAPVPAQVTLRIEVERTLDQGLPDSDSHFWNDRLSPVIVFNEFELSVR